MHPELKAALTQIVSIEHHGVENAYGEPTTTTVGPLFGRFETNRSRTVTPEGDQVTLEGLLFVDGPDLYVGQVEAGDVVLHPNGKRRAVRIIEPLYDLEGVLDHWEIQF